jgi:hypothetical protein
MTENAEMDTRLRQSRESTVRAISQHRATTTSRRHWQRSNPSPHEQN